MAETFKQYEKNKAIADTRPGMEVLIDTAMDQTELLKGVHRRVTAFVDEYQKWADLDPVYQDVSVPSEANGAALMFDDLKILLDKFPQRDF